MGYKKTDILPNKLSSLLSLALDDMEKVHKDDRYVLDMGYYHLALSNCWHGRCLVCLAGSVIAKTLEADVTKDSHPYEYNFSINNKLLAIDNLRVFELIAAKGCLVAATSKVYNGTGNYYHNLFLSKLNDIFCMFFLEIGKVTTYPRKYIKTYRRYVWFLRLLRL